MIHDPCNLIRFLEAQEKTYSIALTELRAGKKKSHWSWFIFPQIIGLGSSPMSIKYALSGLAEAKAYFNNQILGARLKETVETLLDHNGNNASQILGDVDAKKFHSCLTLFNQATDDNDYFQKALNKYSQGKLDHRTIELFSAQSRLVKGDLNE